MRFQIGRLQGLAGCAGLLLTLVGMPAHAQQTVRYTGAIDDRPVEVEAVLTLPQGAAQDGKSGNASGGPSGAMSGAAPTAKRPAVVLVHSAGGWSDGTTGPLAKALAAQGFVTLEPRVFERNTGIVRPERAMPIYYGALAWLAARDDVDPERIGIAGFSMGAHVSIWTASAWLTEKFGGGRKFAAHAPIYPVCWPHTRMVKGQPPGERPLPFPAEHFLTRFTGAPVKIFAAGKDDYDDRDPKACEAFVQAVPEAFRAAFEVLTYPDATHGWNQQTQSFYERVACKGRGCMNTNVNNPEVTARSLEDVTRFFVERLMR